MYTIAPVVIKLRSHILARSLHQPMCSLADMLNFVSKSSDQGAAYLRLEGGISKFH